MNLWDIPERPDLEARIAELEAELADALPAVRAEQRKTARAEARLAAVIKLCDDVEQGYDWTCYVSDVRAAATGDTE